MWIDSIVNFYDYAKCDSIIKEDNVKIDDIQELVWYFITYKVVGAIPICILSIFIAISLTYRSIDSLIGLIKSKKSFELNQKLNEASQDTCLNTFGNVNDDHEVIFSKCDLIYVMDLLNAPHTIENPNFISYLDTEKKTHNKKDLKSMENIYIQVKRKNRSKIEKYFRKYVYDWSPNFRFTSRFINTIVVAFLALFFLFLYWTYYVITLIIRTTPRNLKIDHAENATLNIGKIIYRLFSLINPNYEEAIVLIKVPKSMAVFLQHFRVSMIYLSLIPIFLAMTICVLQMFLLIRETKRYLIELYKGKCQFVKIRKNYKNETVFSSSFHFGG